MIEECRNNLSLLNHDWVYEAQNEIVIKETAEGGEGTAKFLTNSPSIVIKADDHAPLIWSLKQAKCADGAIVTFGNEGGPKYHLVELKSKLTVKAWVKALSQFEGMFLTTIATCSLLMKEAAVEVVCYIVFSEDALSNVQSTAPILAKTLVGSTSSIGHLEAWAKEVVDLPYAMQAKLMKSAKNADGVADFGTIA